MTTMSPDPYISDEKMTSKTNAINIMSVNWFSQLYVSFWLKYSWRFGGLLSFILRFYSKNLRSWKMGLHSWVVRSICYRRYSYHWRFRWSSIQTRLLGTSRLAPSLRKCFLKPNVFDCTLNIINSSNECKHKKINRHSQT